MLLVGKVEPFESRLEVIPSQLIGACYYPNFNGIEEMMYVYIAKKFKGELSDCDEGDLYWKMKDEIIDLNAWESDRLFLLSVLNEDYFTGIFYYDGLKFIEGTCALVTSFELEQFIADKKRTA